MIVKIFMSVGTLIIAPPFQVSFAPPRRTPQGSNVVTFPVCTYYMPMFDLFKNKTHNCQKNIYRSCWALYPPYETMSSSWVFGIAAENALLASLVCVACSYAYAKLIKSNSEKAVPRNDRPKGTPGAGYTRFPSCPIDTFSGKKPRGTGLYVSVEAIGIRELE